MTGLRCDVCNRWMVYVPGRAVGSTVWRCPNVAFAWHVEKEVAAR